MTADEKAAAEGYTARWNAFRRKTMVLTAPELIELVGLLRDVDRQNDQRSNQPELEWTMWMHKRAELEKLLGLHEGSLDTSRRV